MAACGKTGGGTRCSYRLIRYRAMPESCYISARRCRTAGASRRLCALCRARRSLRLNVSSVIMPERRYSFLLFEDGLAP